MANCKDCIHEKVCVIKAFPDAFENTQWDIKPCDHFKPTADVVPKSEVKEAEAEIERLKHILDCYALQYGTVMDKYIVIEGARAEVAREIFEEIESISSDFPLYGNINTVILSERDLDFIKKKYTEDKQ